MIHKGMNQHTQNSKPKDKYYHEVPLGSLVQVRFDDGRWYEGKVNSQRSARGNYHVIFDDGDKLVSNINS